MSDEKKDEPVIIDRAALQSITSTMQSQFAAMTLPRCELSSKEMQQFLLYTGLEQYIQSKGIKPNFKVQIKNHGSTFEDPID